MSAKKWALGAYLMLVVFPAGLVLACIGDGAQWIADMMTKPIDRLAEHGHAINDYINDKSET